MTIQDKFSTIPDNAQVSVLWSKGAAEFICDAGQIKRAMECEECGGGLFIPEIVECSAIAPDKLIFTDLVAPFTQSRIVNLESSSPEADARDIGSDVEVTGAKSPIGSWMVHYGNYFPREVDSIWPTREQADEQCRKLNDEDELGSRMWEISPM